MHTAVLLLLALTAIVLVSSYPTSFDEVAQINSRVKTWQAGVNKNFMGKTLENVKSLLGWRPEMERKLPVHPTPFIDPASLPTTFSAVQQWPTCKTIGTIYNQAECGSCWAFGGVEAAADRFCIVSKGAFNQALSFAEVVECSNEADGCDGGSASATWDFISSGIVTDACYPYYIPTCPPAQQPCLNFVETPSCWSNNTCVNGAKWAPYTAEAAYGLNSISAAQQDIMTNGPIEACFSVYEDFLHYKSGVYIYDGTSEYLGGHCIKIIGWGVESGVEYWLANNQWTTYWGDNGRFKIQRGTDMCGIEDDMVAGIPNWPN